MCVGVQTMVLIFVRTRVAIDLCTDDPFTRVVIVDVSKHLTLLFKKASVLFVPHGIISRCMMFMCSLQLRSKHAAAAAAAVMDGASTIGTEYRAANQAPRIAEASVTPVERLSLSTEYIFGQRSRENQHEDRVALAILCGGHSECIILHTTVEADVEDDEEDHREELHLEQDRIASPGMQ